MTLEQIFKHPEQFFFLFDQLLLDQFIDIIVPDKMLWHALTQKFHRHGIHTLDQKIGFIRIFRT